MLKKMAAVAEHGATRSWGTFGGGSADPAVTWTYLDPDKTLVWSRAISG